MREGWQKKTLVEVCEFSNGLWKGKKPPFINAGVIRNTNFTKEGALDDSNIAYIDVEKKQFENRRLQFGDVILEKSGGGPKQPVGRVILFDKKDGLFSFSNFTSAIRVKNKEELDFRFLHKQLFWVYLSGVTENMQRRSTGIRNLSVKEYKAIQISIPPLLEQHHIVAILDEAFAAIATAKANTEKNLQNAREVFESQLFSVFSAAFCAAPTVRLSELATDITDGDHMPPPKSDDGVPFITIKNINKNSRTIDFSDTFKVPLSYYKNLKGNRKPSIGDVLYTVTGSFGIPVLVEDEVEFCFQRHIGLVRPKVGISSRWLYFLLLSPQIVKQANAGATGTAQKTVSLRLLRGFEVPNIPQQRQEADALKLATIEQDVRNLEVVCRSKLTALDELKQSLLHQAFTGALTAKTADRQLAEAV